MIVVDLGCVGHQGEDSIEPLINHFHPDVFYGFDPHPGILDLGGFAAGDTEVHLERKAAWIHDGTIGFDSAGLRSQVREQDEWEQVPCFDLAAWLQKLPDDEIIVKMDIEGAEKPVLEHLIETNTDLLIDRLLIEWHGHRDFVIPFDADELRRRLRCPVETWHLDVY